MLKLKNILTLIFGLALASTSTVASAEMYKIEVKRLEKDLYRVLGTDVIIKTRYCYVYSYGDKAVLDTDSKKLIFINQNQTCDVVGIA